MDKRTHDRIILLIVFISAGIIVSAFSFEFPWELWVSLLALIPVGLSAVLVEKKFKTFNKELYSNFQRAIRLYSEEVESFVISDLKDDLNNLKIDIEEETGLNTNSKRELLAEVCYQLGRYYYNLGTSLKEGVHENFITAFNHNPNKLRYAERACHSLYVLERNAEALTLCEKVLKQDPVSQRAWYVKSCLELNYDFASEIIPHTAKNGFVYRRLVSNYALKSKDPYGDYWISLGVFNKEEVPPLDSPEVIDYYILKLGQVFNFNHRSIKNASVNSRNIQFEKNDNIHWCYQLSQKLDEVFETKDILEFNPYFSQIKYFLHYSHYLISGAKDSVRQLAEDCHRFWKKPELVAFVQTTVVCLSQTKQYEHLLKLAEQVGIEDFDLEFIVGFTHFHLGDPDKAFEYLDKYYRRTNLIRSEDCPNMVAFFYVAHLKEIDTYEYYREFLQSKRFDNGITKSIVELTAFEYQSKDNYIEKIEQFNTELSAVKRELPVSHLCTIARAFKTLGEFGIALEFLNAVPQKEEHEVSLFLLIECLYQSKTQHEYVIELLEVFRNKYDLILDFLEYEIDLCEKLDWHERVEQVSELGLTLYPDHSVFWTYLIYALSFQEEKVEKLHRYLETDISKIKFSNNQLIPIVNILFRSQKFSIGLDMIFDRIQQFPKKESLKEVYLKLIAQYENHLGFEKIEVVSEDCSIQLVNKSNNQNVLLHLNRELLNSTQSYAGFIGKRRGEVVALEKKLSDEKEEFQIVGIHNKYQGLFLDILEEASDKSRLTGYDIAFFTWDGKTLEDMNKALVKGFGLSGEKRKILIEERLKAYEKRELGFIDLAASFARSELYELFSDLTNKRSFGYWILPSSNFNLNSLANVNEYVLDFPSVCTFSLLEEFLNLKEYIFLVPQSLIDILKERIYEIESMEDEQLSLSISVTQGVVPTLHSKEFKKSLLNENKRVLDWVLRNCKVAYATNKLDLIATKPKENFENGPLFNYVLDTLMLAMSDGRSLISDDLSFYKLFGNSNNMVGIEFFLESKFNDELVDCQMEMLKNNFIGLKPSFNLLKKAFQESPILESSNNVFRKVLRSLGYNNHQSDQVLLEVVDFTKFIFEESFNLEYRTLICETLFSEVLKGYPKNEVSPDMINSYIDQKLYLLGNANIHVKKCLINAIQGFKK